METAFSSGWSSALVGGADTIVARATPAGRGGLAVIRISGPDARGVAAALCPEVDLEVGWVARLGTLRDREGARLDRVVVTSFPGPRSYTGEDMVEISVHGSPWLVASALEAAVAAGARPAAPGEFTRRGVANGKLDLVQAEAVNDLVRAQTAWQARLARSQLEGVLSKRFAALRDGLVAVLAEIEGALDFAPHDIAYRAGEVRRGVDEARAEIAALVATAAAGRRVREGLRLAILGPRNSGKSTLFNLLVGGERAIVSPHPGTTRDVVEAEVEIGGVPVVLQDTAGVGDAADPVEAEGMRRARGAAAEADAVLLLWPADGPRPQPEEAGFSRPAVAIRSKWDLAAGRAEDGWLAVSCRTGEGVGALRRALEAVVASEVADLGGEVAVSERHRAALERASAELEGAEVARPELAAEAVRAALESLAELTGEVASEEVLDRVFATFCIGK
ncbi:MAG TPA: tRNA uridine-5-carboxymethylaminomethyl(34) synthesis GTPase MnmE [Candidatus Sulfomarinibacteraceae bacterium]|nr:tRNA uridine-5-carboxymethylaminomethyl(34) synthesis GTPase MnmE [Candidatus Sulfomarinibacteraceae bacterium]